ncbi:hypothetical protein ABW19_dt0209696 [Dactylella cylindrospora]|nr:hypothetical protein ABW19_dt0209696 [Dactylella cylindrospora]
MPQIRGSNGKCPTGVFEDFNIADYPMPGAFPSLEEDLSPLTIASAVTYNTSAASPSSEPAEDNTEEPEDLQFEGSDWYSSERWPQKKVDEQENQAASLIGDSARIKATLEFYGANKLQYHTKWASILADHIILLAEAMEVELNAAVALAVSQSNIISMEQKRSHKFLESLDTSSLRGKRKIPRTDQASISKGTHPMRRKNTNSELSAPVLFLPTGLGNSDQRDVKLTRKEDFLETLCLPPERLQKCRPLFQDLQDTVTRRIKSRKAT